MSHSSFTYPEALAIEPLAVPPWTRISVPGSKSITNRALVLAALKAKGFAYALRGALRSEDTEVMITCLRALGFRVLTEWADNLICISSEEFEPPIPAGSADLFVGNSGTTMRFLAAMVSLGHGEYRLDGVPRMRERPIEDLLAALRQLGVEAYSESNNGCPPVIVKAAGLGEGVVRIKADVSSQYLSGLMMAACRARGPVRLHVAGNLVSEPYVRMTSHMMEQFGCPILKVSPGEFLIVGAADGSPSLDNMVQAAAFHDGFDPRRHMLLRDFLIEPDASAASYFWGAAAITGGKVTIAHLPYHGLQGDVRLVDVLEDMGCAVARNSSGIAVTGGPLRGIDVDMNDISDTVMTLGAVACFAEGPTTIRNVAHIRHKETDRLFALATELRRVGAKVDEFDDGLTITPGPLHGAEIETYNDHRMAMSMSLIGLKVPGIVIKNPGCVAKTYPNFFQDLEKLR